MNPAPFAARVSWWRMGLMLVLSLGFLALAVVLMLHGEDVVVRGIGLLCAAFAIAAGLVAVGQLARTEPVIEIDARGVRWRRWSDDFIPWPAIVAVEVRRMNHQRFLCLTLRDRSAYPSTHLLGRLAGANRALGFGDIALSAVGTDRSFTALVAAVAAYRRVDGG